MKTHLILFATLFLLLGTGCGIKFGADPKTDREAAEDALGSGDYASALTQAQAILDDPAASDEDKQKAYLIKGQAILGKNNATTAEIQAALTQGATDSKNLIEALPVVADAEAAADALNTGSGERSHRAELNNSQQTARLVANLIVVVKMFTYVFAVDSAGITLNSGFTLAQALDYLFPTSGRGVPYYTAVVEATIPKCNFPTSTVNTLNLFVTAMAKLKLINDARNGGTVFTYEDGTTKTITGASNATEIEDALDYWIKTLNL